MATNRNKDLIRLQAESDLVSFIRLVHPMRMLGDIHVKLIRWLCREEAGTHQLVLLPRDHQKSALAAYYVAWKITRNPAVRVLYISSTSNLAVKQLKFIKDILTCDIYRFYWPDMVSKEEANREKWTETEISVDHPARKKEAVRDPTVFAAGLTTNVVGLHADDIVLDDAVVPETAFVQEGRDRLATQVSLLAAVASTDSHRLVVGTRYHPKDQYNTMMKQRVQMYNDDGDLVMDEFLYEKFEAQVENRGDGTGEFLWPRQVRYDGRAFGFDQKELAKKRADFTDRTQYRAQYYNNPNDMEDALISPDYFQYYEPSRLKRNNGIWFFHDKRLNIFAAIDFAWSMRKEADYSSIVVCGIDGDRNYYVLDIDRFKTNLISEYYRHILQLHRKWDFRAINAEVTVAQQVVVDDIKRNYVVRDGLSLSIKDKRHTKKEGDKEERISAVLQPRYNNRQIWHYQGGHCQTLEEELVLAKPEHDDVKDALASCIELCDTAPPARRTFYPALLAPSQHSVHTRFGGII